MPLNKCRIGDCVQLFAERCERPNVSPSEISGVDKNKLFFEPAQQVGDNTSNYKIVPPGFFACNLMHVGRDKVLPIARNRTKKSKIVSPAYTVFKVKDGSLLLPEFLFMFVNSSEKDRYFWFHCDSSIRDGMDWDTFCNLCFEVPDVEIQRKYIDVFNGSLRLQEELHSGLDDLKMICDGSFEKAQSTFEAKPLSRFIRQLDCRNSDGLYTISDVKGISINKEFIETKADMDGVPLSQYFLVPPGSFAYVPVTSRNGEKITIAHNSSNKTFIVSSSYIVFKVEQDSLLLPDYLLMFFNRPEFDRYARFNSWGSAREVFSFEDMKKVSLPLPSMALQKAYSDLFLCYKSRAHLESKVRFLNNRFCPLLIDRAIKEGSL